jgi:WhiB family redox-sensing transcriptional regulator
VAELLTPEFCAWMMSTRSVDQSLPDLTELLGRPAWMERAACRGEDPAAFFPSLGGSAAKARTICSSCAVRQECLSYALADPESAGVWGGTAERERRKLARSVAPPATIRRQCSSVDSSPLPSISCLAM